MRDQPSDYFLGAVLRGFDAEAALGPDVTCSGIWDRLCMEAAPERGAFQSLFAWDRSKGGTNRIGTIKQVIDAGYVPGLHMDRNAKGREIVKRKE